MKKFDPTKPVQTRSGYPARILTTDLKTKEKGHGTIVAAVEFEAGQEATLVTDSDGVFAGGYETCNDLVNIPPAKQLRTRWVIVYPTEQIFMYRTEVEAREASRSDAIAIVPIEISFTEWQGL